MSRVLASRSPARSAVAITRHHARRLVRLEILVWILPIVVFVFVRRTPDNSLYTPIGAFVALAVFLIAFASPARALLVLLALLPFQPLLMATLYRIGFPAALVRPMASWRDVVGLAIIFAGGREIVQGRSKLDTLDRVALGFVFIVTLYLALPHLLVRPPSATFAGPPLDLSARLAAYRVNVCFPLLLVALRRVPLPPNYLERVARVVLGSALVVSGTVVFEFISSGTWNRFIVETLQYRKYEREVLNIFTGDPTDVRFYIFIAGKKFVRPESTMVDSLATGFYLVTAFAISIERMARSRSPGAWVVGAIIAPALLMTNVRSAIVAALVVSFLAVRARPGRTTANRARIGLILAIGAVLLIPAAAASQFTERSSEAANTSSESTGNHLDSFHAATSALWSDPMGLGLGTQPGVGDRFRVQTGLTSEDAYLQVGNELGIFAMVVFIAMVLMTIRRLKDATVRDPSSSLTSAVRSTAIGYAIGGLFLHVWIYLPVSITFWSLAGLVIGVAERRDQNAHTTGEPFLSASAGYPYP